MIVFYWAMWELKIWFVFLCTVFINLIIYAVYTPHLLTKYLFDKLIKKTIPCKKYNLSPYQSFDFLLNDKVIDTLAD